MTTFLTAEDIRERLPVKPSVRVLRQNMRRWPTVISVRNKPLLPEADLDAFLTATFGCGELVEDKSRLRGAYSKSVMEEKKEILEFLRRHEEKEKEKRRQSYRRR